MEPFPPDLIAHIATELYRQGAHDSLPEGTPTPDAVPDSVRQHAQLPWMGGPPSIPKEHLSEPFGLNRLPSMPELPYQQVPSPSKSFGSLPAPSPSMPSTGIAPELPTFSSPASIESMGHSPSIGTASVVRTEDGLTRFVSNVRSQPHARREQCLDQTARPDWISWFTSPNGSAPTQLPTSPMPLDVGSVRNDFPILHQRIHGHPLAWLDNAATTQKPQVVLDAIHRFYQTDNSNIHRGAHSLAARATDAYELSRQSVANFIGAKSPNDIVFARGTTEAINLVANTYGARYLKKNDEIILTTLEHHANIVPWQMIAKRKGAVLRVVPVDDRGEILLDEYARLLSPRTRIVSITHASNSLGTILPIAEMTAMAKAFGARVLIDGAQSVAHLPINVQALGCDFFVFSGHKIFGPTGVGALYITEQLHDAMPPWQGGGNMIKNVTFEKTTYSDAPAKFEAGTPNIADAVGLRAALEYVQRLGLPNIAAHEHALLEHATHKLASIPGLRIVGTAREKVSVISFVLDRYSTEEVGKALDQVGIAVRSGHHCAQPSLRRFGLEATVRPSFSIYNTHEEVERLVEAVQRLSRGKLKS